jgi:cytochrome b pre-mRNA-processing protein 3
MIPRHLSTAPQTQEFKMLRWLRERAEASRTAGELYGAVVTAARQPAFYGEIGVPDTPAGRFELVALHLFLALGAFRASNAGRDARQGLIEAFVSDMDGCMREMGVGDLGVPKKVKRAAAAFYERATVYQRDLQSDDADALAESLRGYILADAAGRTGASCALARYVRAAATSLAHRPFGEWLSSGDASKLLEKCVATIRVSDT